MHEFGNVIRELPEQRAEENRIASFGFRADLIVQIVVRVVLANDLDDDANADCQGVSSSKHVIDKRFDALV